MTTSESEEPGQTAPIEVPQPAATQPAEAVVEPPAGESPPPPSGAESLPPPVVRAVTPGEREVLYVPLAVSVGDGFKFGCGFFLALVLAMLVGFVLLAALFAMTSIAGVNLPIGR